MDIIEKIETAVDDVLETGEELTQVKELEKLYGQLSSKDAQQLSEEVAKFADTIGKKIQYQDPHLQEEAVRGYPTVKWELQGKIGDALETVRGPGLAKHGHYQKKAKSITSRLEKFWTEKLRPALTESAEASRARE